MGINRSTLYGNSLLNATLSIINLNKKKSIVLYLIKIYVTIVLCSQECLIIF